MAITFLSEDLERIPPKLDLAHALGRAEFSYFIREQVLTGLSDEDIYEAAKKHGFRGSLPVKAVKDGIAYIAKFERANIEAERAAKEESERKFTEAAADHLKLLELLQERLPSMIESIKAAQAILSVEPEA